LAFQLRFPQLVVALLLCDTGPGYRREEARARWNAMAERQAAALERRGLEALGDGWEVLVAQHRSATGLALAARGILAQRDSLVLDALGSINVPTLVVVGADDAGFLAAADVMASKIPGAEKIVLAGAGHAANLDQPEAFDRAVLEFLERF
jgi:pimeloyl-ACP methyl ester carboxylesterase